VGSYGRVLGRVRHRLKELTRPTFASPTPEHHRWLRDVIWAGEYDRPGFVPRRGENVVDVGANVGVWTVRSAKRGAHVRAYEPHPTTFEYLRRNTARWRRRVTCHQAALVPELGAGTARLYVDPSFDTRHSLLGAEQRSGDELVDYVDVPAITLETVIGDGCDLMKMDCEGVEFGLVAATPPEALRRIRRLVAELHGEAPQVEGFADTLRALGFEVRTEPLDDPRLWMCFARQP
jgi:FkbM family methyltransferase